MPPSTTWTNLAVFLKRLTVNNKTDSKRQQTTTVDYKRLFNGFVLTWFASLQGKTINPTNMETQKNKIAEIPTGNNKEDFKMRKQIIWQFYQEWKKKNPSQKRYNLALKDYINIRFVSIDETSHQAAKSYLSTLAVLQLDSILTMAKKYREVKAKPKDRNQKHFNKLLWMRYNLPGVGEVKLMVGIVRRTNDKVQYCITVIKA